MNKIALTLLSWGMVLHLTGCDDGSSFKGGVNESKPFSEAGKNTSSDGTKGDMPGIFRATYQASVEPVNGGILGKLCDGIIKLSVEENMKQSLSGSLNCTLMGEMNLDSLMPDMGEILDMDLSRYEKASYLTRLPNSTLAAFDPPRIYMLTPLIQDPSKFINKETGEKFSYTQQSTFNGAGVSATGQFQINVLDLVSVTPPNYPETFNDVLKFEVLNSGFDTIPADAPIPGGPLFDKMTFYYSTRPIALPKIEIEFDLKKLPKPEGTSSSPLIDTLGGVLLGKLKLTLDLVNHETL